MSINDRISTMLSDLSAKPADVDLSAIASLLSEIRETIGTNLNRAESENGLSQPGAAATGELQAKISKLENDLASFNDLFEHLKNVVAGKVNIVYKDSRLRESILSDLSSKDLSIQAFIKLKDQIDYQFNTAWFPQERNIEVSKNHVFIPANHKSGGIPWHHE